MFLPTCHQAPQTPSPTSFSSSKTNSSKFSTSGFIVQERLRTLSSRATSDAPDLWVAMTIIFSASTYFFDYGSNIATAWKYFMLEYRNKSTEVTIRSYGSKSEFPGIFPGIIAIMVLAHVVNALIFYLHLDKSREALKCAYLLPVIYLRKLVLLVWRTGHFEGVRDLRSGEIDAVYNILAAALETGPQLILQFHVFAEIGYLSPPGTKAPSVLVLSIVASFLSGAYNGGQAMVATTRKATLLGRSGMGILGGLHLVSALLVRSVAFELITEEGFYHFSSPFRYYYVYIILAVIIPCVAFWMLLKPVEGCEELEENRTWKRVVKCISYAYVSITLGPLYPLASHAKQVKKQSRVFWVELFKACMAHLLLDVVVVLLVCGVHGRTWLTPCYLEWSRKRDRKKQKVIYHQQFMTCSSFKALLIFSLTFYVVTIVSFIALDMYTENMLEKKNSFATEEDSVSAAAAVAGDNNNNNNSKAELV